MVSLRRLRSSVFGLTLLKRSPPSSPSLSSWEAKAEAGRASSAVLLLLQRYSHSGASAVLQDQDLASIVPEAAEVDGALRDACRTMLV